jgi:hypothetical protein
MPRLVSTPSTWFPMTSSPGVVHENHRSSDAVAGTVVVAVVADQHETPGRAALSSRTAEPEGAMNPSGWMPVTVVVVLAVTDASNEVLQAKLAAPLYGDHGMGAGIEPGGSETRGVTRHCHGGQWAAWPSTKKPAVPAGLSGLGRGGGHHGAEGDGRPEAGVAWGHRHGGRGCRLGHGETGRAFGCPDGARDGVGPGCGLCVACQSRTVQSVHPVALSRVFDRLIWHLLDHPDVADR